MNTPSAQPKKPLKDALLERIESEKVCPHSRLYYQGREFFVWVLWLLSVIVGASAIAVSLFVMVHGQYSLYEATHANFFTFLVDTLPYLWIVVFGLMVYVAIYNLRHTKRGYRYPLWMILASSIVLSFAAGSAMQLFGLGYAVDDILGEYMEMYTSQGKYEERLWQDPDDGRLLGHQVFATLAPTSTVIFEDTAGRRWRMNVTELDARDVGLLARGETVRLYGKATNIKLGFFHACGAFPWLADRDVSVEEMSLERQVFVERVHDHARKLEQPMVQLYDDIGGEVPFAVSPQSVCATADPVRRMPLR